MDAIDPLAELEKRIDEKATRGYNKVQKLYLIASIHREVIQEENPVSLTRLADANHVLTQAEKALLDWYADLLTSRPNFPERETMLNALSKHRNNQKFRQKLIDLAMRFDESNPLFQQFIEREQG